MQRLYRVLKHTGEQALPMMSNASPTAKPNSRVRNLVTHASSSSSSSSSSPVRVILHANGCGQITLNRLDALNALNLEMIKIMLKTLREWRSNPQVRCVLIDANVKEGRKSVFCAGGDVKFLHSPPYAAGPADFLRYEYTLDNCVYTFPKPIVSLLDGLVIGGGVGLVAGSTHKISTNKTEWSMPETLIGLFPDVGTTYFLSRMPRLYGYYLALTGVRINHEQLMRCGFANWFADDQKLPELRDGLINGSLDTVTDAKSLGVVLQNLGCTTTIPRGKTSDNVYNSIDDVCEACFSKGTVNQIMVELESVVERKGQFTDASVAIQDWAKTTLKQLRMVSPTSLMVTLQQLELNKTCDVKTAFRNDYRLCLRLIEEKQGDFKEGVRALLIDKDRKPKWNNASFSEAELNEYVAKFKYDCDSSVYVKELNVEGEEDTPVEREEAT